MTTKCFVDTNIWIYAVDTGGSDKSTVSAKLIRDLAELNIGVISVQTLGEFSSICTKKLQMTPSQVQGLTQAMDPFPVVAYGKRTVIQALDLMKRISISFWDAVMVITANEAHCTILFTEDLSHGQVIEGVRIHNPFIEVPNL